MSSDDTKELRVHMRVSNNRMRKRREELGLTMTAASERAGVGLGVWSKYENLHDSPLQSRDHRKWRPTALKMARVLGVPPEWLWPDSVLEIAVPSVVREIFASELRPGLTRAQMAPQLTSPEEIMDRGQVNLTLEEAIAALPPKERAVLRKRFGFDSTDGEGETLAVAGEEVDVGRERARGLEAMALARLRGGKTEASRRLLAWWKEEQE